MKSKYSNAITLLFAILAFLPVVAVDFVLDGYVRARESGRAQQAVDAITADIQASVYQGIGSLREILAASPSLCTPTFVANIRAQMQGNVSLREVLVENANGVQYCNAFGADVRYSVLSRSVTLPGRMETLSVVRLSGQKQPVLKVTHAVSGTRYASAFVQLSPRISTGMPLELSAATLLRFALTSGGEVLSFGDDRITDVDPSSRSYIVVNSFAGEVPLRAVAAIPFSAVRADYADLDLAFTLTASLMSGGFLMLALQYVRRSQLPAIDLERAIAAGELRPYYQPVVNLQTGRLEGCEVLIRWEKANGEVISPNLFIEYAELTGLAIPMTLSLIEQVKRDLSELCQEMPELKIGINLFEGHFRDGSFVEDVQAIFEGSPVNYRQLVFEITERRPLGDSEQVRSVITGLHALGAKLAIDDVGTGHSNLAYVQTLGADVLKIDRVFVDMIRPEIDHVPVLDGLIAMAHDLGTDIIAEGVETEHQARYLRARGVVKVQGFLFSPAIRPSSYITLARALNGRPAADAEAQVAHAA